MTPLTFRAPLNRPSLTGALLLALCFAAPATPLHPQQPDSAPSLHRAVERIDRKATVRFAARGRRPVSGTITRLTADSVYVQAFDWPVGMALTSVDTVWEHVGVRDPAVHRGFLIGGIAGGLLGAWFGYELCGLSDNINTHCEASVLGGGLGFGLILGTVGGVIAGVSAPPPRWQQRWP